MKTLIIAEAGVNHNGSLELAKQLVDVAVDAGVDVVKFQTFKAEALVSRVAKKAEYQKTGDGDQTSQLEMIKNLELPYEAFRELKSYAESKGIEFLSTAFDYESMDFLKGLPLKRWKVPSGEITNLPYLEYIGSIQSQVIVSTGMSELHEVKKAIEVLESKGTKRENITVLHCNTEYPTPFEDVNLRAMLTMGKEFDVHYGYSDHTQGVEVSVAAVAMGARLIEKHFTLDKAMPGPDHSASLDPGELKELVRSIRTVEKILGSSEKKPSPSEFKNREIARRSIVAKTEIREGETLTEENICVKRPGSGISPMKWYEVLGSVAKKNYEKDDLI